MHDHTCQSLGNDQYIMHVYAFFLGVSTIVNRESKSRTVYLTYAKTMNALSHMIDLTSMLVRKPEFIDQY